MTQAGWLVARALIAVLLMVGFYLFAITIAIGLLLVPVIEYQLIDRVHFQIAAVCLGAGGAVLWALVPRPDRFEPPGPALNKANCPELFRVVEEIASATKQQLPSEVFLLNEVNAWVAHRGGVMGIGSRRVMGVGWPLLIALSPAELKAVLAHEFGHYVSGDVSVGPWIYKTRAAIGRAIAGVRQTFLQELFLWYGRLFLRLTQAVSRRQEFIADEIAARLAGPHAMMTALRRVEALAPAYSAYLSNEFLPALRSGYLPPVAIGFRHYVGSATTAQWMSEVSAAREQHAETELFDSHPSLKDRLAALQRFGTSQKHSETEQKPWLLDEERSVRQVLEFAWGPDQLRELTPISWDAVGDAVYVPLAKALVDHHRDSLGTLTMDQVPGEPRFFISLAPLVHADEVNINSEERIGRALHLLSAALTLLLLDAGWRVTAHAGSPVTLWSADREIAPRLAFQARAAGRTSDDEWRALCDSLGVTGRSLKLAGEPSENTPDKRSLAGAH